MVTPPVTPPPDAPGTPDAASRKKMQQAASAVLYTALVLLALWIIRDFIPAFRWAASGRCVMP